MRVPTISKEDADKGGNFEPWPIGEYEFEVNNAEDDVSKASGREQIKLTLWVFNAEGNHRTVFDYLGSDEKSQWKVRHCCEAIGMIRQYEGGSLDAFEMVGKTGRLSLAVKRSTSEFPANNTVRDYIGRERQPAQPTRPATLPRNGGASRPAVPSTSRELDDEIPF